MSAARLSINLHANHDAPPQRWKTSEVAGEGIATNVDSVSEAFESLPQLLSLRRGVVADPVYQLAAVPRTLQPEGVL